jgi:tryptophan synthase alpha chain
MRLTKHTDGFIVGSALINRCAELWEDDSLDQDDRLAAVEQFARRLKTGDEEPVTHL